MKFKNNNVQHKNCITKYDTEYQTFGCKHSNPDICGNNGIENICAFASKDNICKRPSRTWKKQYEQIKMEGKNGI